MNDAVGAPSRVLRVVSALVLGSVVLLATVASAQERPPDTHPLRDTMKWTAMLVGAYTFDHKTSIDWSSYPTNCQEGNRFRRNPDGTLNGWKAAQYEAAMTGALAGTLYLAKRFHWRYVGVFAKTVMVAQTAEATYYGFSSLALCHPVR